MRKNFDIFIISIDRNKYIAHDTENETTIKGMSNVYPAMETFYKLIFTINFSNKNSIFRNLQEIKNKLYNSEDPNLFGIPNKDNKYSIFLKGYGQIEVSKQTLKIMDLDDIDKEKYFRHYIEPFAKSIVVEFVR